MSTPKVQFDRPVSSVPDVLKLLDEEIGVTQECIEQEERDAGSLKIEYVQLGLSISKRKAYLEQLIVAREKLR